MKDLWKSRPSPAMVVALIALFVSLSGSALALKGRNTVNSGDIINGQVKDQDVGNNEISSEDVENATGDGLTGDDVEDGTLSGDHVAPNSIFGDDIGNGITGDEIVDGFVSAADLGAASVGPSELATIDDVADPTPHDFGDQTENNDEYVYGDSTAQCPAGEVAIAGGGSWEGNPTHDDAQFIHEINLEETSVTVRGGTDVDNDNLTAEVTCLQVGAG